MGLTWYHVLVKLYHFEEISFQNLIGLFLYIK